METLKNRNLVLILIIVSITTLILLFVYPWNYDVLPNIDNMILDNLGKIHKDLKNHAKSDQEKMKLLQKLMSMMKSNNDMAQLEPRESSKKKTKKNKTDNSLMIVKKRMDNQTQEVRDNIYYKEWYSERMKINQKRVKLFQETCSKYKNEFDHEIVNPTHFVFVDKLKTMGCFIEKVGSTSLRQTFRDLRLNVDKIDPSTLIPNYHGQQIPTSKFNPDVNKFKAIKDQYTKFILVREPMERLASCYNDKMVLSPYTSLLNWRKEIIIRANLIRGQQNFTIGQVSLDDFLIAVVLAMGKPSDYKGEVSCGAHKDKSCSACSSGKGAAYCNGDCRWIGGQCVLKSIGEIHSPIASNHWEPYYKVCAPCHMKYDYVSHLDPTKEEDKFLWDSVGLNSSTIQMTWVNGLLISSEDKSNKKEDTLAKLYSSVPRSTLVQVYQIYKFDYEMFGYDFNDVLKLGGHHPLSRYEASKPPEFSQLFAK